MGTRTQVVPAAVDRGAVARPETAVASSHQLAENSSVGMDAWTQTDVGTSGGAAPGDSNDSFN